MSVAPSLLRWVPTGVGILLLGGGIAQAANHRAASTCVRRLWLDGGTRWSLAGNQPAQGGSLPGWATIRSARLLVGYVILRALLRIRGAALVAELARRYGADEQDLRALPRYREATRLCSPELVH